MLRGGSDWGSKVVSTTQIWWKKMTIHKPCLWKPRQNWLLLCLPLASFDGPMRSSFKRWKWWSRTKAPVASLSWAGNGKYGSALQRNSWHVGTIAINQKSSLSLSWQPPVYFDWESQISDRVACTLLPTRIVWTWPPYPTSSSSFVIAIKLLSFLPSSFSRAILAKNQAKAFLLLFLPIGI